MAAVALGLGARATARPLCCASALRRQVRAVGKFRVGFWLACVLDFHSRRRSLLNPKLDPQSVPDHPSFVLQVFTHKVFCDHHWPGLGLRLRLGLASGRVLQPPRNARPASSTMQEAAGCPSCTGCCGARSWCAASSGTWWRSCRPSGGRSSGCRTPKGGKWWGWGQVTGMHGIALGCGSPRAGTAGGTTPVQEGTCSLRSKESNSNKSFNQLPAVRGLQDDMILQMECLPTARHPSAAGRMPTARTRVTQARLLGAKPAAGQPLAPAAVAPQAALGMARGSARTALPTRAVRVARGRGVGVGARDVPRSA